MMSRKPRRNGHRRERAFAALRVPFTLQYLARYILQRRLTAADRFRQPADWLRLVALGILLIDLALLAFGNSLFDRKMDGFLPGMGSIFAGLLVAIITMRIARPALYFDWLIVGALNAALGIILMTNTLLTPWPSFALFCLLFMAMAISKLWIGITMAPGNASAWLLAAGMTSLFCFASILINRFAVLGIAPDIILTTDLTLTGFAIIGFGFASRNSPKSM